MSKAINRTTLLSVLFLAMNFQNSGYAQQGDVAAGKKAFRSCVACHKVGEGAKNGVGPTLNGIVGRKAGTVDGYKYGKHLVQASEEGLVWTPEELDKWLLNPKKFLRVYLDDKKAKSKMNAKVKKDQKRADIISYLGSLSE